MPEALPGLLPAVRLLEKAGAWETEPGQRRGQGSLSLLSLHGPHPGRNALPSAMASPRASPTCMSILPEPTSLSPATAKLSFVQAVAEQIPKVSFDHPASIPFPLLPRPGSEGVRSCPAEAGIGLAFVEVAQCPC